MGIKVFTPILFLIVPAIAVVCPFHSAKSGSGQISSEELSKLVLNNILISQLDERIDFLKEKLKQAAQIDPSGTIREIEAKVAHLEESSCAENQFECGSLSGECIYELFVCDGRKDCSNGLDEDEAVCSIAPALAGHAYTGHSHWTSCETREDHQTNITILGYRIRKYSSSIIWLKALIESSYKGPSGRQIHVSHSAIGHYKFSNRQMVLLGEGAGSSSGAYCYFNKGDNKRATCDLVKISTRDHCATIHLTLDES